MESPKSNSIDVSFMRVEEQRLLLEKESSMRKIEALFKPIKKIRIQKMDSKCFNT